MPTGSPDPQKKKIYRFFYLIYFNKKKTFKEPFILEWKKQVFYYFLINLMLFFFPHDYI
jgi:hypothetical protein